MQADFLPAEPQGKPKEILLSHKNNEIMPFAATWMDLEIIRLSEMKKVRKILYLYYVLSLTRGIKCGTNELIYETETESWTWRTDWWLPKGRGLEEGWSGRLRLADVSSCIQNG